MYRLVPGKLYHVTSEGTPQVGRGACHHPDTCQKARIISSFVPIDPNHASIPEAWRLLEIGVRVASWF